MLFGFALLCNVLVNIVAIQQQQQQQFATLLHSQHYLADHKLHTRKVLLSGKTIDTLTHPNIEHEVVKLLHSRNVGLHPSIEQQELLNAEKAQFIVQVDPLHTHSVKEKVKELMQGEGGCSGDDCRLVYIPHHSFLFMASYQTARAVASLPGV